MKGFLITLFAAILSVAAVSQKQVFAQDAQQETDVFFADPLKPIMSEMGENMKILVAVLVNGQVVPEASFKSAAAAMPGLSQRAAQHLPAVISDGHGNPKPGQEQIAAKYKSLMNQLTAALSEMNNAIQRNNKPLAKSILMNKVVPIQKEGHKIFKPQPVF